MNECRYVLCKVKEIFRDSDGISISCDDGTVTRSFARPKQGLHLREGNLIIRYESGNTVAIDKITRIEGNAIKIKRVLWNVKETPSIKRSYINLDVWCY